MTTTYRTVVVLALAAAVAVRISAGDGLTEDAWRGLVAAVGTLGAVRLARRCDPREDPEAWSPWVGAVLYGAGPIVMSAALRTPFDAMVYAALPWIAAPVTRTTTRWWFASSAVWLAVAGLGSAPWAIAAVVVGVVAAMPRRRADLGDALRWLLVAVPAASWWVVGWVLDPPDLEVGSPSDLADGLARTAGAADLSAAASALILGGPALCLLAFLLWRAAPGRHRFTVLVLAVAAGGFVAWFLSAGSPSAVPVAGIDVPGWAEAHGLPGVADVLAAGLALVALGGLLAWVPLTAHLVPRARTRHVVATVALVLVGAVSAAGALYAAHERLPGTLLDQAIAGISTHA